ncbi:MAG: accessory factor UbiK family protein [Gammaproteobacteria bacterium]|nr:MAG: accessory factor UbiK family protein [Gammaproteobacteria bacterium]
MNKEQIDALARRLADSLPADLVAAREDLARNFSALLQSGLEQLDLVSREEFDVQRKVLERTRERLTELERELARLEGDAAGKAAR